MPSKSGRYCVLAKWQANGRRCAYCAREIAFDEVTCDHVRPRSRGGSDKHDNLVPACGPCNNRKGSKTADEFGGFRAPVPSCAVAGYHIMRHRVFLEREPSNRKRVTIRSTLKLEEHEAFRRFLDRYAERLGYGG